MAKDKFIIEPHFRLQEWVAEEKGYFKDEGLDYIFRETIKSTDGKHHDKGDKKGAMQMIEAGKASDVSCACHWTVGVAASKGKAKLYGEVYAVHLAWPWLWDTAHLQLTEHNLLERRLVTGLLEHGDPDEVEGLARHLFDAEVHGATRPHPRLPHAGFLGLVTRRIWAVADRFWDVAEGRVIPEPVHPPQHRHDSLLAQYLVADPQFDPDATIVEHRHRDLPSNG